MHQRYYASVSFFVLCCLYLVDLSIVDLLSQIGVTPSDSRIYLITDTEIEQPPAAYKPSGGVPNPCMQDSMFN